MERELGDRPSAGDDRTPSFTPEEVIQRIAQVANNIGIHAGVGGCETAGAMISFLAANPDRIPIFLRDGWIEALGDVRDPWSSGCLTFYRKLDGAVTTPEQLRAAIAKAQGHPSPASETSGPTQSPIREDEER